MLSGTGVGPADPCWWVPSNSTYSMILWLWATYSPSVRDSTTDYFNILLRELGKTFADWILAGVNYQRDEISSSFISLRLENLQGQGFHNVSRRAVPVLHWPLMEVFFLMTGCEHVRMILSETLRFKQYFSVWKVSTKQ